MEVHAQPRYSDPLFGRRDWPRRKRKSVARPSGDEPRNYANTATWAGGYVATGGHGGILGAAGHDGPPLLHYLPTARHTWRSEVNLTRLPAEIQGVRREGARILTVKVALKGPDGGLIDTAIPKVLITKDANYWDDDGAGDPEAEVDLIATKARLLLMASLMKFGSLPQAADPDHPTAAERTATAARIAAYSNGLRHPLSRYSRPGGRGSGGGSFALRRLGDAG